MSSNPQPRPCTSCGAPILDVRHNKTKNLMPLDAEPVPNGGFFIKDGLAYAKKDAGLFEDAPGSGERYQSHYAICPNAAGHRKRKGGKV